MAKYVLSGTTAGPSGVVVHSDDELDRTVWVRVAAAADGRFEIVEVYLDPGTRPISTDDLRRVPLGRIEAWANGPGRDAIAAEIDAPFVSLTDYVEINKARSREIVENARRRRRASGRLPVPDDRRSYGDAFYERVAEVYGQLLEDGRAPAPTIAEVNAVPVTTARRWVKEARRRGYLGPGRAGKAG